MDGTRKGQQLLHSKVEGRIQPFQVDQTKSLGDQAQYRWREPTDITYHGGQRRSKGQEALGKKASTFKLRFATSRVRLRPE